MKPVYTYKVDSALKCLYSMAILQQGCQWVIEVNGDPIADDDLPF